MLRLLLEILVTAYLPGAVVFRLPGRTQAVRATLSWDERCFWAVTLSLAWSLTVVMALAFVGRYSFERLILINVIGPALIALALRGRLLYRVRTARPSWAAIVPLVLIVLGTQLYFPPSEYIMGGKDPGTYLNEGLQIAQRGSLFVHDTTVSGVPAAFRDLFFPWHQQPWYYGIRFMGFFIQDPAAGTVVGQFPHLFPASIAIGYGLNGLTGARQAVGVWMIMGLLAVYFGVARLFGRRVAAGLSALMAINVIAVWFGRYPNSEVMLLALLFTALLAFGHALDHRGLFFGAVAGGLLGGMLFLRYEVVLAFASVSAAALLVPAVGKRVGLAFPVALVLTAVPGYFYLQGPMQAYSYYPLAFTRDYGLVVLAGVAVLVLGLRVLLRWHRSREMIRRWLPVALAVMLASLAAYAYFLREPRGRLALHDAIAFRSFAWYVGPWVLGLAVAGVSAVTALRFWQAPALLLTIATFSVFFFYKTRIVPEHFWAARRFLAVILPGALLGITVSADWGARRLVALAARRTPAGASGTGAAQPNGRAQLIGVTLVFVALLSPVAWHFWRDTRPVWRHVEYAGLIPHLEQLASRIGDRDLLLVESRNSGSDLHVLAEPLAYIYARHVLVLDSVVPPRAVMAAFVDWAATQYDRVLFLGGGGSDLLSDRLVAVPLVGERFEAPEYESALNAYPSGIRRKDFEFGLYRLQRAEGATATSVRIDVGGLDDLNVVRFYARERSNEDVPFRWTGPQSFVAITGLSTPPTDITIWMSSGGRPPAAPPATVEVAFDDVVVGNVTVGDGFRPYTFAVQPTTRPAGEPGRIRLRTATWNPSALLGVPDTRDLGVMVTRVEVR